MISPDSKIFMDAVKGALGTDGENIEININKKEKVYDFSKTYTFSFLRIRKQ